MTGLLSREQYVLLSIHPFISALPSIYLFFLDKNEFWRIFSKRKKIFIRETHLVAVKVGIAQSDGANIWKC